MVQGTANKWNILNIINNLKMSHHVIQGNINEINFEHFK